MSNNNDQELNQNEIDAEIAELVPIAIEAVKDCKVGDWNGNVKDRFQNDMQWGIVRFTWRNILNNTWANGVCWGQSRVGKTSAIMQLSYTVYHDWDCVLKSIAFGLNSVVWKMDNHIPLLILEQVDKIYNRIPILLNDDAGSCDNKSITQNDESFNFLKGGIDLWGTRLSNLWHTMNQPSELTKQLAEKYTCELYIAERGIGKFDTVKWQPNFRAWVPFQKKKWKQTFPYEKPPMEIYRVYAEKRDAVIDDIGQRYRDKRVDTQIGKLLERTTPIDFETLSIFKKEGCLTEYDVNTRLHLDKESFKRIKGRDLIEQTMTKTEHYKYDISILGLELLKAKQIVDNPEAAKKEYTKND
jgi:hypothetical protein